MWTESRIAAALARQTFERRHLVLVLNCSWTGHECDLMVVTSDLRVIDVEVKISRADLKADAHKDKWWIRHGWQWHQAQQPEPTAREWPPKVWKHYFALPAEIWQDALFDALPSPKSGVILLSERDGKVFAKCVRRSTPNREATRLKPAQAVDIARLASLRMWHALDARRTVESIAADLRQQLRAANQAQAVA